MRILDELIQLPGQVTGQTAGTFLLTSQDIFPYDNGVYRFNSITQPHVASDAPVVGLLFTVA